MGFTGSSEQRWQQLEWSLRGEWGSCTRGHRTGLYLFRSEPKLAAKPRGFMALRYTTRVEIELPRQRVIELFENPDHYSSWQESLVGLERLDGEAGQVGRRTRLQHKMGKREIEMLETITQRDLPDMLTATYEAKGVWNQAINRFEESGIDRTTWSIDTEFRCSGIMWVLTKVAPGMFKKQTQSVMEGFKAFAEAAGQEDG